MVPLFAPAGRYGGKFMMVPVSVVGPSGSKWLVLERRYVPDGVSPVRTGSQGKRKQKSQWELTTEWYNLL